MIDAADAVLGGLGALASGMGATAQRFLFSPGSSHSLAALACTLGAAALFLLSRRAGRRPVRVRLLARALFPRSLWRSRSGRADIFYCLFNIFLAALIFGSAILFYREVGSVTGAALTGMFGPREPGALPPFACVTIMTIAFYLAYELAYWLNHYLSHRIPFLWHFHAVHHSAETLSLLTNFRQHPLDSIVFYNMIALFTGATQGALDFAFGGATAQFEVEGVNVLILATAVFLTHLQHSRLWISFGDRWDRIVQSPAHHQIHHSSNPEHFDRNFGASLAIWDWLFGTLHLPSKAEGKLRFGVPDLGYDPHSVDGALVMPFVAAARDLRARTSSEETRAGAPTFPGTQPSA